MEAHRRSLRHRLDRSLAERGLLETLRIVVLNLRHLCVLRARHVRETVFDLRHGVRTRGVVGSSAVRRMGRDEALPYEGTRWRAFRALIRSLDIRYEEFTFIDVGCGRGRALLLAAEFPFRRVIGLELLEEFASTARENARRYRGRARFGSLQILTVDATEWAFPPEPSLVYLFNPIREGGIERLVKNLELSLERAPRALLVYYAQPDFRRQFDDSPAFEAISTDKKYVVYRAHSEPAPTGRNES